MKLILTTGLLLLLKVKSASLWFEVYDSPRPLASMTIAGPNQEYVVQGKIQEYSAYQVDWVAGTASHIKDFSTTNANIAPNSRIESGEGFNCVLASQTIVRFNAQQGVPNNEQEYSVPKGAHYGYPTRVAGTNYVLVSSLQYFTSSKKRAYRLQSDTTNDVKIYNTGGNSWQMGVVYQTGWAVISMKAGSVPKIFDFTNGYIGGTNSTVETHPKPNTNEEIGFFCPEADKGVYVIGTSVDRTLQTVKVLDGSTRVQYLLSGFDGDINLSNWITDTDLCVEGVITISLLLLTLWMWRSRLRCTLLRILAILFKDREFGRIIGRCCLQIL